MPFLLPPGIREAMEIDQEDMTASTLNATNVRLLFQRRSNTTSAASSDTTCRLYLTRLPCRSAGILNNRLFDLLDVDQ